MDLLEFNCEIAQQFTLPVSLHQEKSQGSRPGKPLGLDASGMLIHPTICMLNCVSVGHRVQGKEMVSG